MSSVWCNTAPVPVLGTDGFGRSAPRESPNKEFISEKSWLRGVSKLLKARARSLPNLMSGRRLKDLADGIDEAVGVLDKKA